LRLEAINRDLELQRERRRESLESRLVELRKLLESLRESIAFREEAFRDAISASLQILKAAPLTVTATSSALEPLASPYQLQANTSLGQAEPLVCM
jgi:hypothetical protein